MSIPSERWGVLSMVKGLWSKETRFWKVAILIWLLKIQESISAIALYLWVLLQNGIHRLVSFDHSPLTIDKTPRHFERIPFNAYFFMGAIWSNYSAPFCLEQNLQDLRIHKIRVIPNNWKMKSYRVPICHFNVKNLK